jgi:hypothetical protein
MEPILSEARCYGSFMLAALDVSDGDVMLDPDATGRVLFDGWVEGSSLASFTLSGAGATLSSFMNNKSESVSYWSSCPRPLPFGAMTDSCCGQ